MPDNDHTEDATVAGSSRGAGASASATLSVTVSATSTPSPAIARREHGVISATDISGTSDASFSSPLPGTTYDADFYGWATEQAALLRAGRVNEADLANIAEEIEDLAKRDRRELASRVRTVLRHLMKLRASSAQLPRAGWRATVDEQRIEIARLLTDSPSLRGKLADVVAAETGDARRLAAADLADYGEVGHGLELMTFSMSDVLE